MATTERQVAGRQIGPLGTASRIIGGAVAIAFPISSDGLTWLEALIAFVGLPLIAALAAPVITALFRRLASAVPGPPQAISAAGGCALIAVIVIANAALVAPTSANGNVTIWVWLGASMLLAAWRGYGGCEVLAIPNLLSGRREEIGCVLYTTIDRAEARRRSRAAGARRGSTDP